MLDRNFANSMRCATALCLFAAVPFSVPADEDVNQSDSSFGGDIVIDGEIIIDDDDTDRLAADARTMVLPPVMHDPAFERYVDIGVLLEAWGSKNPELLTDVALQLLEGERILLRSHKAVSAEALLETAVRAATAKRDAAALERLSKVAQKTDSESLKSKIAMAEKLGAASRADDQDTMVSLYETSAEAYAAYRHLMTEILNAQIGADAASLEAIQELVIHSAQLTDTERNRLFKLIASSRSAIPEDTPVPPGIAAMNRLTASSRGWLSSMSGGRISTPDPIRKIAPRGISMRSRETYSHIPEQPRYNRSNSQDDGEIVVDHRNNKPFVPSSARNSQNQYRYLQNQDGSIRRVPNPYYRP